MSKNVLTVARGTSFHSVSITTNIGTLRVSDRMNTTLTALGSIYRFYRFKKLEICLMPSGSYTQGVMYVSTDLTGAVTPPTFADYEGECALFGTSANSVPQKIKVPPHILRGVNDWYITDADATDPLLDEQGTLSCGSSSATDSVVLILKWEVEFKEILDSTIVALRTKKLNKTRVKSGLEPVDHLKLLSDHVPVQGRTRSRKNKNDRW